MSRNRYKDEYNEQVEKLAAHGLTYSELATFFDVNKDTFLRWLTAHPLFKEAFDRGKVLCTKRIEQTAYDRVISGDVSTDYEYDVNDSGVEVLVKKKVSIRPCPHGLLQFLLVNKDPKNWSLKDRVPESAVVESKSHEITINVVHKDADKPLGN